VIVANFAVFNLLAEAVAADRTATRYVDEFSFSYSAEGRQTFVAKVFFGYFKVSAHRACSLYQLASTDRFMASDLSKVTEMR